MTPHQHEEFKKDMSTTIDYHPLVLSPGTARNRNSITEEQLCKKYFIPAHVEKAQIAHKENNIQGQRYTRFNMQVKVCYVENTADMQSARRGTWEIDALRATPEAEKARAQRELDRKIAIKAELQKEARSRTKKRCCVKSEDTKKKNCSEYTPLECQIPELVFVFANDEEPDIDIAFTGSNNIDDYENSNHDNDSETDTDISYFSDNSDNGDSDGGSDSDDDGCFTFDIHKFVQINTKDNDDKNKQKGECGKDKIIRVNVNSSNYKNNNHICNNNNDNNQQQQQQQQQQHIVLSNKLRVCPLSSQDSGTCLLDDRSDSSSSDYSFSVLVQKKQQSTPPLPPQQEKEKEKKYFNPNPLCDLNCCSPNASFSEWILEIRKQEQMDKGVVFSNGPSRVCGYRALKKKLKTRSN